MHVRHVREARRLLDRTGRRELIHSTPTADDLARGLRLLTEEGEVRVVWRLKNGRPAHVLTREERARGGRVRAAKAAERKESLRQDPRGSAPLIEAAQRLGEMLHSDNVRTAQWADNVVSRHILDQPPRFEL